MSDFISIRGARQHNLKNIDLKIPKNKLVVFTGLSGSGKSSLAFDTIYAEGQRRYVESLSSYARQFLGVMNKPDVDGIEGLSPAISIDQKTTSHNPRSTVGTITEIYDYLRLLFARVGHPHCPKCGLEIAPQSAEQIVDQMLDQILHATSHTLHAKFMVLSPIVQSRKGEFRELFENLQKKGLSLVRVDRIVYDLEEDITLIKTNKHSIDGIIERFTFDKARTKNETEIAKLRTRLTAAVETSLKLADGQVLLTEVNDASLSFPEKPKDTIDHLYSEHFACPVDNISLPENEPRLFSFNAPQGACSTCNGLGVQLKIDPELLIALELSISEGAIIPYASMMANDTWFRRTVEAVLKKYGYTIQTEFRYLPKPAQEAVLHGDDTIYTVEGPNQHGKITSIRTNFEGFIPNLQRRYQETESEHVRTEIQKYMREELCPACNGKRLKPEALSVTISEKNIYEVGQIPIDQTAFWVKNLPQVLSAKEQTIGSMIIKELEHRLQFLVSVGLNYLNLNRTAGTLSGGESQRIRLASQIGTGLTGVLYVLDEPTIGLHQRDNLQLIHTLKDLRDLGNTVIVVEHDQEVMEQADFIVDFGPGAGKHGGKIVSQGDIATIKKDPHSSTGQYLSGKKQVLATSNHSRTTVELSQNHQLVISGCSEHNLKNITAEFPLGKFICVTGVSGSGKSTLVHDTLFHALSAKLNHFHRDRGGKFTALHGAEHLSRVSLITQSPIGRTPRSNPVTYTKVFDHIRELFAQTQEAKIRGYGPGRFSFNVKGGRCEACQGGGEVKIEMQFLPDVYVTCDVCRGQRYNHETLQVAYKSKNIADILHLTVDEALEFFAPIPQIRRKLDTLQQVGLGYIELGQPAPQLSGGEAQRIKLAKELSVSSFGHTIYILDEPTTGLHFADVEKLLNVLKALVAQNNTIICVEHNLDVIKNSDWVIDLGPEGGEQGGGVVAIGTPQDIASAKNSYTGQFLSHVLN